MRVDFFWLVWILYQSRLTSWYICFYFFSICSWAINLWNLFEIVRIWLKTKSLFLPHYISITLTILKFLFYFFKGHWLVWFGNYTAFHNFLRINRTLFLFNFLIIRTLVKLVVILIILWCSNICRRFYVLVIMDIVQIYLLTYVFVF